MIQLDNVHKSYGQTKVLKGIELQIQDQDDVVILGPSGSGKSTFLNVLSGLEKVDEGHILIQGQDLSQLTDAQLTTFRREKIAFIFQQYYLLPNLTVRQNVKMGADLANNHDFLQIIEDWGLAISWTSIRVNCRVGNSRECPLLGPWPKSQRFSSWMSRRVPSMKKQDARFSTISGN